MDAKETFQTQNKREPMLYNVAYYKYIFKKTEKIVCALFFILKDSDKSHNSIVADSLRNAAKKTLDEVIVTLSCTLKESQQQIRGLATLYVALESNVRLAQADLLIEPAVADMLCLEIEVVLKGLRNYLVVDEYNPLDLRVEGVGGDVSRGERAPTFSKPRAVPSSILRESLTSSKDDNYKGQVTPRRQAIKDILYVHRNATIKDISAKIQDCSEKTLQRELISMIKDGLVHKEGERRWSTYSLI